MKIRLTIHEPRPYFAEVPYYLWGEVNYKSDGDCRHPTDQQWTGLQVINRTNQQQVLITGSSPNFTIKSDNPELAARTALLLVDRSGATLEDSEDVKELVGSWSHAEAVACTHRVQAEFPRMELKPFDSKLFWGSWKWVGWYATEFTWVGRWIMNSVLTHDTRAIKLCVDWLRDGTIHEDQSAALRHALASLTGLSFHSDAEWVGWYDTNGQAMYPEPDFKAWLEDLKRT